MTRRKYAACMRGFTLMNGFGKKRQQFVYLYILVIITCNIFLIYSTLSTQHDVMMYISINIDR